MDVEPFLPADEHRERDAPRAGLRAEHVVIGKIARLFHLKGHEDVITAAMYLDRDPTLRFLFVGDGILRDKLQSA